ncbi:MAG: diguanylate cyclase [Magnetococcales bacterium]|nr:diguanylate cyclase [Magnetococcales bacterium]NGZ04927.1 diguanylate cyclase [Magnetococcales bacterium]
MRFWLSSLQRLFPWMANLKAIPDRLGGRILLFVGCTFLVGWLLLSVLVSQIHEHLIMSQNERSVLLVTRSVASGLRTIMLAGDAEIAENYLRNLQEVNGMLDFRILRIDGSEAFRTNETIRFVNNRLGGERFSLHKKEIKNQILPSDSPILRQMLVTNREVPIYEQDPTNQTPMLTFIAPIPSQDECRGCHGQGDAIRGVIKLTMSLAKARQEIEQARWWIYGLGILIAGMVMLIIHLVVRRSAVAPLEHMTKILSENPKHDLERFIPLHGCAEFRQMATAFNQLTTQLRDAWNDLSGERDKLTTIVLSAREGIVVTNRHEEIVLVNPAAERLLGRTSMQIRNDGFLHLFHDPVHMNALRADHAQELPGLVWFNERMLQIHAASIEDSSGHMIGAAAMIRDVTREKALEDELRKLSHTDGLTGLHNRRRFDAALLEEYDRAKRYGLILGILLLDVDHFKRFNDSHGHDQGDRVLKGIAEVMRSHFRSVDYVCRLGGEEFCVIMPSTGASGVIRSAERLRSSVEQMVIDDLHVTVSIGVAIFPEAGQNESAALIKAADQALYTAKKRGRNQICYFTPELSDSPARS